MSILLPFIAVLILLLAFIAGYIIGRLDTRELNKQAPIYKNAVSMFQHATKPSGIFSDNPMTDIKSGPVYRPTPQQLKKWHEPQEIKEEKEALAETFAKNPMLNELKQKLVQGAV